MTQQSLIRIAEIAAGSLHDRLALVQQIEVPMSLSSSDSDVPLRSFAALDTHGLSLVHDDLPASWTDGGATHILDRIDATSWKLESDGVLLGILSLIAPDALGEAETWKISDPQDETLGIGASWPSWEDAVANLVEYRRRR
jgi:hypothetical protein